jgi:ribonuclease HII
MGRVPRVPHLKAEWRLWQDGRRLVVGVDEVGMGALCAPVLAAAVLVRPNTRKIEGVRDSKTLSERQRDRVVAEIKHRSLAWGVGAASVAEIERLNIYHASHLAMRRALARIPAYDHVLVDGRKIVGFEAEVGPYTSIVDGDASSYAIACASIIAKVTRDRLMTLLAARPRGRAGAAGRDAVPSAWLPADPRHARGGAAGVRPGGGRRWPGRCRRPAAGVGRHPDRGRRDRPIRIG